MICKPNELNFTNKNISILISGLPGVGKTTIALSTKDVLLIDCDNGLSRVNPEHRRDASVCKTYEEVRTDIESAKGHYKTIVIDTCGALIEYLKDWAVRTDAKASKAGGGISLQGYGLVKQEFKRLAQDIQNNFNVVYLFHETKEKNQDDIFYDIICEGAAKTIVWQPMDLAAHLHILNGERYLGFTPTAQYNAKSAYGIKGLVKVPELEPGQPNDFLDKLFAKIRENLNAETKQLNADTEQYKKALAEGMRLINECEKPNDFVLTADFIKNQICYINILITCSY